MDGNAPSPRPSSRMHMFIQIEHDGLSPHSAQPSPAQPPKNKTTFTPGLPVRPSYRRLGPSTLWEGTVSQAMPRPRAPSDTQTEPLPRLR